MHFCSLLSPKDTENTQGPLRTLSPPGIVRRDRAYAAIDGILARGKVPFLVGGTGLYVRAVTEGFTFTDARPDPALRAELEEKVWGKD